MESSKSELIFAIALFPCAFFRPCAVFFEMALSPDLAVLLGMRLETSNFISVGLARVFVSHYGRHTTSLLQWVGFGLL